MGLGTTRTGSASFSTSASGAFCAAAVAAVVTISLNGGETSFLSVVRTVITCAETGRAKQRIRTAIKPIDAKRIRWNIEDLLRGWPIWRWRRPRGFLIMQVLTLFRILTLVFDSVI